MRRTNLLLLTGLTLGLCSCAFEIKGSDTDSVSNSDESSSVSTSESTNSSTNDVDETSSSSAGSQSSSSNSDSIPEYDGYNLVWSDEFDGTQLDSSKWGYQIGNGDWGWGNGELQYYTSNSRNSSVADGILTITAMKDQSMGNFNYTSARITTSGKFSFAYGKIEARMSLPITQGMWPAFWLLPSVEGTGAYGGWPSSGEIDIMERIMDQSKVDAGNDPTITSSAIHYYNNFGGNNHSIYQTSENHALSSVRDWHVYGCEWTPDYIKTYIDEQTILIVARSTWAQLPGLQNTSAPFDKPFYILLNLAVGGRVATPAPDFVSDCMKVDYVRVYQAE